MNIIFPFSKYHYYENFFSKNLNIFNMTYTNLSFIFFKCFSLLMFFILLFDLVCLFEFYCRKKQNFPCLFTHFFIFDFGKVFHFQIVFFSTPSHRANWISTSMCSWLSFGKRFSCWFSFSFVLLYTIYSTFQ